MVHFTLMLLFLIEFVFSRPLSVLDIMFKSEQKQNAPVFAVLEKKLMLDKLNKLCFSFLPFPVDFGGSR